MAILILIIFATFLLVAAILTLGFIGIIDIKIVPASKYYCTYPYRDICPFPLACEECTYYRRLK